MQVSPKTGSTLQRQFFVESEYCCNLDGLLLLSSSHLVWELEQATLELIQDSLEDNEVTLPVEFNLEHRSFGIEGDHVTCTAKVVHREGPLVTFQVTAEANGECLAQGLHKRRVIRKTNLQARLQSRHLSAAESR